MALATAGRVAPRLVRMWFLSVGWMLIAIFSACVCYRVILPALFSAVAWSPLTPFETVFLPCVFFWASSIKRISWGHFLSVYNFAARFWWQLLSLYAGTASVHCTVIDCCRWLSASAQVLHSCFLIFANSMKSWYSVYVPKHVTRWPFLKD